MDATSVNDRKTCQDWKDERVAAANAANNGVTWVLKEGETNVYLDKLGNTVEWPGLSGYKESKCDERAAYLATGAALVAAIAVLAF